MQLQTGKLFREVYKYVMQKARYRYHSHDFYGGPSRFGSLKQKKKKGFDRKTYMVKMYLCTKFAITNTEFHKISEEPSKIL